MKRGEKARRWGRFALIAATLGGAALCVEFADGVGTVCANDGETTNAVKSTASARLADCVDFAGFPLATPGEKAGERRAFTVDGVEFAFRWAPPGRFWQGSPETEEEL